MYYYECKIRNWKIKNSSSKVQILLVFWMPQICLARIIISTRLTKFSQLVCKLFFFLLTKCVAQNWIWLLSAKTTNKFYFCGMGFLIQNRKLLLGHAAQCYTAQWQHSSLTWRWWEQYQCSPQNTLTFPTLTVACYHKILVAWDYCRASSLINRLAYTWLLICEIPINPFATKARAFQTLWYVRMMIAAMRVRFMESWFTNVMNTVLFWCFCLIV